MQTFLTISLSLHRETISLAEFNLRGWSHKPSVHVFLWVSNITLELRDEAGETNTIKPSQTADGNECNLANYLL